jgi:CCR4-NOT transcription complex subunit 7/8
MLKLIQLGLSFTDGEGNWAEGCTCWQFNFKFSLSGDMFAQDSIELLKTSGIDFPKFEEFGIDVLEFGELIMMSGLVLNDDVKWISFHSSYDFGYLVKTLTCSELPIDEGAFMDLLHTYFPYIYDVKVRLLCLLLLSLPFLCRSLANQHFSPPSPNNHHKTQNLKNST